jgi:hypothetical protein
MVTPFAEDQIVKRQALYRYEGEKAGTREKIGYERRETRDERKEARG